MKALIVDDIAQARNTLKKDLEIYCSDIEVVAEASGVVEAVKYLNKNKIDIVFLDIQMEDGSGFDVLDMIPEIDFHIIFITANDGHALRAFKYSAVDYLLKPVDPDDLVKAVSKLQKLLPEQHLRYDLLKESNKKKHNEILALNSQDRIQLVRIDDIIRCQSEDNYTFFFMEGGKKIVVSKTLKEYDELLQEHKFIRVHHSHLVNARKILELHKNDDLLILSDHSQVPVSSRKKQDVIKALESL
ncbi:response regulator transcription factor [Taibaiella lutea]|uniref:Response regulator transcription factor n=1 Tax=Taibaiella lutea TaxID=2608001 RepID=A0A5M6CQN6_9BACT|nr:LytTR family DNA-binding domain-containing protein [Taibaiella lutea]KAA5536710.1 response regulator transcription factor [Taibaiella lutea]